MSVKICFAVSDSDLEQILTLQKLNLRHIRSSEEEAEQGFVTVIHDFELLKLMNTTARHVIARDGDKVIGYALAMTREFRDQIAALESMFAMLDKIVFEGKTFSEVPYMVMGQICVDSNYRGKGVFREMYNLYFSTYKPLFKNIITEVAVRNTRSLNSHLHLGFEEIYRYEESGVEEWVVLKY
jgi:GNAT superfamily N-acetyltransferase